jgi:hypothetical protein
MAFKPITIDQYIAKHLKDNPATKEPDLRKQLQLALNAYGNGIKCSCGNDIWIIGSAFAGNGCFTCITGESFPEDDYEIDTAIKKRENKKGRRHINDIDPTKIAGFFDDEGYEIVSHSIKKPSLCLICKNNDDPDEDMLCNMTRHDQKDEPEFKCFAFRKK